MARIEQTETPDANKIRCGNMARPTKWDKVVVSLFLHSHSPYEITRLSLKHLFQDCVTYHTVFPHIVSADFFEFENPKVTVHKCAETIQGRKLYEEYCIYHQN